MPSLAQFLKHSRFAREFPAHRSRMPGSHPTPGAALALVEPTAPRDPERIRLLVWNHELAAEFGLGTPSEKDIELLAGMLPAKGSRLASAKSTKDPELESLDLQSFAMNYGGHQFGHFAGQLGDGRAIVLGDLENQQHEAWELQLKGAGPTPYSRRADGRAVLRSSLREYVASEVMHRLGISSTRALSLIWTGDEIERDLFYDGNPRMEPGAICSRMAPSFVRLGNFEIHAARGEHEIIVQLVDWCDRILFPESSVLIQSKKPARVPHTKEGRPERFQRVFSEICRRTAQLMVEWQRVGFVHGVMNTDNLSALGLSLDYGPFGFLEAFDPSWTPNTTDLPGRRYCFGRQPQIALWNLSICQEALGVTLDEDVSCLQRGIENYRIEFETGYRQMRACKLGLENYQGPQDLELFSILDQLLQKARADYCVFYRFLEELDPDLIRRSFLEPQGTEEPLKQFFELYLKRLNQEEQGPEQRRARMQKTNPSRIPRNWQLLELIRKLEQDPSSQDLSTAMQFWRNPYQALSIEESLRQIPTPEQRNQPGASQLSCSS